MELLALGAHLPPMRGQHNGVPMSILFGRPWLQGCPITSETIVFLDNLSHQLIRVDSVHIALRPDSTEHRLLPGEFDLGYFMFGTMLDLTMSPSTRANTTVWCRIPAYLAPTPTTTSMTSLLHQERWRTSYSGQPYRELYLLRLARR